MSARRPLCRVAFAVLLVALLVGGASSCDRPAEIARTTELTAAQRTVLQRTGAHVLLPNRQKWLSKAFLTSGEDWYTASIGLPGLTIVIEGTRKAFDHPEIRAAFPTDAATRKTPRIGRNELIVEAAFIEEGTAFSVEVECVLPDRNTLCTEDAFIHEVLNSLVVQTPKTGAPK